MATRNKRKATALDSKTSVKETQAPAAKKSKKETKKDSAVPQEAPPAPAPTPMDDVVPEEEQTKPKDGPGLKITSAKQIRDIILEAWEENKFGAKDQVLAFCETEMKEWKRRIDDEKWRCGLLIAEKFATAHEVVIGNEAGDLLGALKIAFAKMEGKYPIKLDLASIEAQLQTHLVDLEKSFQPGGDYYHKVLILVGARFGAVARFAGVCFSPDFQFTQGEAASVTAFAKFRQGARAVIQKAMDEGRFRLHMLAPAGSTEIGEIVVARPL
jgi:hypothetical protein